MRKNKNSKKIVLLIVIIFLLLFIGGTGVYFMLNNKGNKPIKINYNDYYSKYVTTIGEVKLYTKENDGLPKRMQHKENLIRLIQSDDHACNEGLGKENWNDVSRLQQRLRRQDVPPNELCRPPWQCVRFMLYRGPRRNMVDRAG